MCIFLFIASSPGPHVKAEGLHFGTCAAIVTPSLFTLGKLKSESMRINSNAMFFGRASIGMKKATNSVAVATLLFATDAAYLAGQSPRLPKNTGL